MNKRNINENAEKVKDILDIQEKTISRELEKRLIQIGEAAKYLFCDSVDTQDGEISAQSIIENIKARSATYFESFRFHPELLGNNRRKVGEALSSLHMQDRITLAHAISELLLSPEYSFSVIDLLSATEARGGVISYVKNIQSDKAYDVFASCFDESRVLYSRNFDECCEQLRKGNVDYCILPLFSHSSGELVSVRRLIDTHELKICAVYDHYTDTDVTRFALLCEENRFVLEGARRYFEFSLSPDSPSDVKSILFALDAYGLELYKMSSTSLSDGDGFFHRFTVIAHEGDILALAVYLELFCDGWKSYGLYSEI